MKTKLVLIAALGLLAWSMLRPAMAQVQQTSVVRLANLRIDPSQVESFKTLAREHVAAAAASEPGLLALHAVAEKAQPERVYVFEMYKDESAYRAHLASPHYKKFADDMGRMATERKLFETVNVRLGSKPSLAGTPLVRVAELQIAADQLDAYKAAVTEEIDASISVEPGVLSIDSVALKDDPTQLRFFEVYADEQAYRDHIASPHFKKYVETTKNMITTRRLVETEPVVLQMKSF
jgi:quinol monooxygenase YgiN